MQKAEIAERRARLGSEEAKREQNIHLGEQITHEQRMSAYKACRAAFCWEQAQMGFTQEQIAVQVRIEFGVTISQPTVCRLIKNYGAEVSETRQNTAEGYVRTKIEIARGHEAFAVQDTTLHAVIMGRIRPRMIKNHRSLDK